jgi:hypothetical protein
MQMQVKARPVILTGFDFEYACPGCGKRQLVGADPDGTLEAVSGEHVSLHALPGRYVLVWDLRCWHCGRPYAGRLTLSSRSATGRPA